MEQLQLVVPRVLNDGTPVTEIEFAAIERDLFDIADGFDIDDRTGAWKSPDGTIYRDPVRIYSLDVSEQHAVYAARRLVSLAEMLAGALDQESIYVRRLTGVHATLVTRAGVLQ